MEKASNLEAGADAGADAGALEANVGSDIRGDVADVIFCKTIGKNKEVPISSHELLAMLLQLSRPQRACSLLPIHKD